MKRFLIIALLVVAFAAGCVAPAKSPVETKLTKHPKPFDAEMAFWKANHGSTAKGQEEECFTCHKPEKFCNKCHAFVGAAPIFEAKAASQPAAEKPAEQPAQEAPAQEAPQAQQAALHGVGTCDSCHDAPSMDDMRAGLHANAFRKQPDIHKSLCKNCHNVAEQCSKCHAVPDVVEQ